MPRMTRQTIFLKEITTQDYAVRVTGTADLLIKARIDTAGNDRTNAYATAADALYWLDPKPVVADAGGFDAAMAARPLLGYPVYAVKKAALDAVKSKAANASARTMLNASFMLMDPDGRGADQGTGPLAVLSYGSVEPLGAPDGKRVVACVHDWSMDLTLRHLDQSKLPIDKIVAALGKGGKGGIGAYAPCGYMTVPGKFGTFKVELLG